MIVRERRGGEAGGARRSSVRCSRASAATKGDRMTKRRFLALWLATATFAVIATSVALATPTSSHSGGANANQIGLVRIDRNDPTVAYVKGNYKCPASVDPAHLFVSVKQVA